MIEQERKSRGAERYGAWIRRLTYGGLLLAIGIVLPQVFHLTGGPASGATFLPMHIPVLIAGLLLGPVYGLILGGVTPVCSFLITAMPVAARLPFMIVELAIYGGVSGLLYHTAGLSRIRLPGRFRDGEGDHSGPRTPERLAGLYISLILAMIAGRVVYAVSLLIMGRLFGLEKADPAAILTAVATGIVGIMIQIIVIPPIIFALQKGGLTNGLVKKSNSQA
jgi:niacin transporter